MKRKVSKCPDRASIMMPCFTEDGESALLNGACLGCGKTPAQIEESHSPIKLNDAQKKEAAKIVKTVNEFAKAMKYKMIKKMVGGATGWDTLPAWKFMDGFNRNVDKIREAKDVSDPAVDLANYAMLIRMREWGKK